jgi:hypothetical protein
LVDKVLEVRERSMMTGRARVLQNFALFSVDKQG